jgi:hypothetical protein
MCRFALIKAFAVPTHFSALLSASYLAAASISSMNPDKIEAESAT